MKDWIQSNKKPLLIVVVISIIGIILFGVTTLSPRAQSEAEVKDVVAIALGQEQTEFDITATLVDTDNWKYIRITSTREQDRGNNSFIIVYQDEDETTLKAGPGTFFTPQVMREAGVPQDVQDEIEVIQGN